MRKDIVRAVGMAALGFSLAAGLESNKNECGPDWRISGKDNSVFVCEKENGRIAVQGAHTKEHIMPSFVTNIWQVWRQKNNNNILYYEYVSSESDTYWDDYFRIHEMDLESGESKLIGTWCEYICH